MFNSGEQSDDDDRKNTLLGFQMGATQYGDIDYGSISDEGDDEDDSDESDSDDNFFSGLTMGNTKFARPTESGENSADTSPIQSPVKSNNATPAGWGAPAAGFGRGAPVSVGGWSKSQVPSISAATPSGFPAATPSGFPAATPSGFPAATPSGFPAATPSGFPAATTTLISSAWPTQTPKPATIFPVSTPSSFPTTTSKPAAAFPTATPAAFPTTSAAFPTTSAAFPTAFPTATPAAFPTAFPTATPTAFPVTPVVQTGAVFVVANPFLKSQPAITPAATILAALPGAVPNTSPFVNQTTPAVAPPSFVADNLSTDDIDDGETVERANYRRKKLEDDLRIGLPNANVSSRQATNEKFDGCTY
jgi:hypothetical protein